MSSGGFLMPVVSLETSASMEPQGGYSERYSMSGFSIKGQTSV